MVLLRRLPGILLSGVLSLAAAAAAAYLAAPAELIAEAGLPPLPAPPPGAALTWMAWTPATGAFFLFILACLAAMVFFELCFPSGNPRRGALGLDTTRGDRLFISLLGSAWILLLWLATIGMPLWGGVGIALAWAVFVFWKV
ncbi:MAG: DUF2160 family membrane protein [Pseudomonadota bacterium]